MDLFMVLMLVPLRSLLQLSVLTWRPGEGCICNVHVLTPNVPDIKVQPPEDSRLHHVIDTMALYVLDGGCTFEQAIMERGRSIPLFSFLFELGSKEHTYYVWRLYSFAQGDTMQRWRTEPFIMITGSGRWVPPPLPVSKSPEPEKEHESTYAAGRSRRIEPEQTLTDPQRDHFEDMLRSLTLERSLIKDAMGFALDNVDAAGEVVEVLTESLTLKETPIPTKVARLMLVSDILHNSSAPIKNASAYRTKFETTIPDIVESFNDLYCNIAGRITAEALKERVLKVLQVWSDWFLFSDAYVNGLRTTFLRSGNSGVLPFHSICADAPEMETKVSPQYTAEGSKTNQDEALAMGKEAAMKELSSLPLPELERRCRHNGLSLAGGRELMVSRLLYLEEAEKRRGYELKDDLKHAHTHTSSGRFSSGQRGNVEMEAVVSSGWINYAQAERGSDEKGLTVLTQTLPIPQPELKAFSRKEKAGPVLPASKWAREDDESDCEHKQNLDGLGLGYSSGSENAADDVRKADEREGYVDTNISSQPESTINEEQRQKLRRLEVALIEYRESLEERGIKSLEEIERKVAVHRKHLQSEYGLSDSGEDSSLSKRSSSKQREKTDDSRESSRKRHRSSGSGSESPSFRSSTKHKEKEDRKRHRDKDKEREKSVSRERDDYSREEIRDRERDRRQKIN